MRFALPSLLFSLCTALAVSAQPEESTTPSYTNHLWQLGKQYLTGEIPESVLIKRRIEDERDKVVRLTDETYAQSVLEGDANTLWVIMIHQDRVPMHVEAFHAAHGNASQLLNKPTSKGLSDSAVDATGTKVVFARMEYNAEWRTCTRWLIFRPPRLVFASDQGKTLRFLDFTQMKPDGEALAKWIKEGRWRELIPWESSFHPTGDKAWILEWYIKAFDAISFKNTNVPPIVWLMLSGTAAKYMMEYLWSSKKPAQAPASKRPLTREQVREAQRRAGDKGGDRKKQQ